ncbi:putative metal-dependent enzyme (double-stranded beta helix superfamily) [Dokdonella fugitiva]|uniref:Putative metal-dependent enzyme (Double-stranded beta helix superfamily) n=1 Tax=Dokdonella fugitiva TaxID=328517 RepID=A0A839F8U1_9GAMM|nr:cysteine dioxygenase family protein [Dokdonella fugitiva]MBA8888584.1 putative metal-dependent enzyme (double-stranded beta helix superfamily) [Dokdonella fugitiva]
MQPGSAADAWLADVRTTLALSPRSPTAPAIARLADELAARALRFDLPAARALAAELAAHGRYHRRLVAANDDASLTALLISWPRAHRTPLHDHAGLWGIELVLDGALEVEEYRLDGGDPARAQPVPQRRLVLGVGDAAVFGGGDYAHRCRNLSATHAALSLHVYGGVLDHHHAYDATPRGDYIARPQRAHVDAHLGA